MQKLAEICIRRPVFATMIILALTVIGITAYMRLGVDRFPSVDLPTVSVRTNLPGASAEEMETEVSKRIEEAVNTVEGIDELRSISGTGVSNVIVTFNLNRNIDVAAQDIRDRVSTVLEDLPDDATVPLVSKFDNDQQPVLTLALSGDLTLRELTEFADKIVKIRLERSSGVGEVRLVGGLDRAINVWVEADRLTAFRIPITAVRDAIVRQNMDASGGNVTRGTREETIRTIGRLGDPRAFEDMVVATIGGEHIRIRDVGSVEDGTREQRSTARLNGVPTVIIEVRRQSGANTVAVIEAAKKAIDRSKAELPSGVNVTIIQDQSLYIHAAMHEINVHLILGSILASLVVLAFMRNWRSMLIAAVAIPSSVISTFGMMWALNFTLNSVTMLALVLVVGIVIDDAIVVLENIFRFIEEKKMPPFEAARAATADIGLAVTATTFSLVIIFIPVSFMSSISGRFLYQFGITAAVAVLVSLLVSFTLTPMMSARLLKSQEEGEGEQADSRGGFYRLIDEWYSWSLDLSLRNRKAVALLSVGVILSMVPLYGVIRQDYLPSDADEGEFAMNVFAPQGVSLASMDEIMNTLADEVRSVHGVRMVLSTAGGGWIGGVAEGRMYVRMIPYEERVFSISRLLRDTARLKPWKAFSGNRSQKEVMQSVRARMRKYTDLRTSTRNIGGFNIGGGSWDINFVFRGPDLSALSSYAESLVARQDELGIMEADTTLKLDRPELRVQIDRARAADLRVDPERVGTAVRLMVGGDEEVSRFRDPGNDEEYKVQLRLRGEDRADPSSISGLYVPREDGGIVQIGDVAKVERVKSASRIDRLDRQREVRLRGSVASGFALADRLAALRAAVEKMNLPAGYTTSVSGRGKELEKTFVEFIWAFTLSIIFMYMILASQFESLVHPFTILLSIPLSIPFALVSIWLTGNTLNLYSALGILVLFGVVKKNAILQIDHMNNLRSEGMDLESAIRQGTRDRLRPILMTTMTFVAGMMPLALGTGPGAEERRAIAVVVIGGQTLSLLLTLLAIPVAYSYLDNLAAYIRRRSIRSTEP